MSPRRIGIINIDKPPGMTSRRVVDRVAHLVRPEKAGHAGTLDPLATGVLVVCVGKATRMIEVVQRQRKAYRARLLLGRRSDTDDVTGQVQLVPNVREPTRAEIESLIPAFVGKIVQAPPKFSAVHVGGERAYKLARRGEDVAPQPRVVDVFRLELVAYSYPDLELEIECGSGMYVRSIGRDLGDQLGCGAVLSALARTRVGVYRIENAVPLDQLSPQTIDEHLLPPATAIESFHKYEANADDVALIRNGRAFALGSENIPEPGEAVAVFFEGDLICLASASNEPRRLLPHHVLFDVAAGRER